MHSVWSWYVLEKKARGKEEGEKKEQKEKFVKQETHSPSKVRMRARWEASTAKTAMQGTSATNQGCTSVRRAPRGATVLIRELSIPSTARPVFTARRCRRSRHSATRSTILLPTAIDASQAQASISSSPEVYSQWQ